MSEINLGFSNGKTIKVPSGTSVSEVFKGKDPKGRIIGAKVDGRLVDLLYNLSSDAYIEPVTLNSDEGLDLVRQS